jgi:hypothetical protein
MLFRIRPRLRGFGCGSYWGETSNVVPKSNSGLVSFVPLFLGAHPQKDFNPSGAPLAIPFVCNSC